MKDFLLNNWVTIALIIVAGSYTMYMVLTHQWDRLRHYAEYLMELAEKSITGTKKGQQRMALVLDQIYTLLPGWLKIFVSREKLQNILQEWYNDIKGYLNNGKVDNSI